MSRTCVKRTICILPACFFIAFFLFHVDTELFFYNRRLAIILRSILSNLWILNSGDALQVLTGAPIRVIETHAEVYRELALVTHSPRPPPCKGRTKNSADCAFLNRADERIKQKCCNSE